MEAHAETLVGCFLLFYGHHTFTYTMRYGQSPVKFPELLCDLCVVCVHRFNHELVFGISVKNLSKAERLIYGDSLMTHAMILTAVTDKVSSHRYTAQVCDS